MRRLILSLTFMTMVGISGGALFAGPVSAASSQESGNLIVRSIPGPTLAETLAARAKTTWPWYLTRASGLVAAGALILLMLSGIGQVTGSTFRILEPLTAWASHRALGITFSIAILIHGGSILFDHFVPFTLWQLLVPWMSTYKPITVLGVNLGSFYVAAGILAFYGALLVMVTSLIWVEKKPRPWKLVHLLTYAVMLLVFVHALYLGTDLLHGILRWIWILLGAVTVIAVMSRLRRANTA